MLNITFIPKMPSPKTCHMILILLACLTIVPTWVLLLHKHYEAVRILTFLEAFPIVAVFLLGAKGMLSTLTRTATASNKTTEARDDRVKTTSRKAISPDPSTTISNPSRVWYTSLIFVSLGFFTNALAMWLFSYSHEDLNGTLHGVTGVLLVLTLVLVGIGATLNMMDSAREVKRNWEQKKSVGRNGKGVESV